MRTLILLIASATLFACGNAASTAAADAAAANVQTINSAPASTPMYEPPPVLTSESTTLKVSSTEKAAGRTLDVLTPEDEKLRSALPFTPAIAMDPTDGNKISIRATTPRVDFKGKIYYFANEEHKAIFEANPDQWAKGPLSHL